MKREILLHMEKKFSFVTHIKEDFSVIAVHTAVLREEFSYLAAFSSYYKEISPCIPSIYGDFFMYIAN